MKTLITKSLFAITTLIFIFIIGIMPVMIISLFVCLTTNATIQDCVVSTPFIIFGFAGIIISAIYVNKKIIN